MRMLATLLLLAPALACVGGLSALGYPACAAACMSAALSYCSAAVAAGPAAPAAVSACIAAASAACLTSCACFDVSTTVHTRTGPREMLTLAMDDEVLTLLNGRPFWTKVNNVHKLDGDFEFVTLWTNSQALTVTPQHPVFANGNGQSFFVRDAGSVSVGDALFLNDGGTEVVTNVTKSHGSAKAMVETEQGTVIANGIFVRCMMPNEFSNGSVEAVRAI